MNNRNNQKGLAQRIRIWFACDCDLGMGITILEGMKLNRHHKEIIKHAPKGKVIELLRMAFRTVDPDTNLLDFDFNTVDYSALDASPTEAALDASPTEAALDASPTEAALDASPTEAALDIKERKKSDVSVPDDAPIEMRELKKAAIKLHKRQSYLHAHLSFVSTDKERYEIAKEIMVDVVPTLTKIYNKIKEWKKTGIIPPPLKASEFKEGVELVLKRESLRTRILKIKRILKNDLESLDGAKIRQYNKELLDKEIELEKIKVIISDL